MFKLLPFLLLSLFGTVTFAQETICGNFYQTNPPSEPSFLTPRCQEKGDVLYIDGLIDDHITYELRDRPHIKRIELNSFGGKIMDAYDIAALVRERGITTNVRKGAKCASACTLIFQAGVYRTAHPDVRFLYHGVRQPYFFEYWKEQCQTLTQKACSDKLYKAMRESIEDNRIMMAAYVHYGMDPQFWVEYMKGQESETWLQDGNFLRIENWIIWSSDLMSYNAVNALSNY